METYEDTKDKLESIRAATENDKLTLNDWELNFIDNIFENYHWTANQVSRIDLIFDRIE